MPRLFKRTGPPEFPHCTYQRDLEIQGQYYKILRFTDVKLDLAESMRQASFSPGYEMLTKAEAMAIMGNTELNTTFKGILKPGEWSHVRDSDSEARSRTMRLFLGKSGRWLFVGDQFRAGDAASMLILKHTKPVSVLQTSGSDIAIKSELQSAHEIQSEESFEVASRRDLEVACKEAYAVGSLSARLEALPASKIADLEKHALMKDKISRHQKLHPLLAFPIHLVDMLHVLLHNLIFHDAAEKAKESLRRKSLKERSLAAMGYGFGTYGAYEVYGAIWAFSTGKVSHAVSLALTGIWVSFLSKMSFTGRNEQLKERRVAEAKELEVALRQDL